jgi:hypothetical protein
MLAVRERALVTPPQAGTVRGKQWVRSFGARDRHAPMGGGCGTRTPCESRADHSVPTSVEAGFPAQQGGQGPGLRVHARQPVMTEPPADVLRVPG